MRTLPVVVALCSSVACDGGQATGSGEAAKSSKAAGPAEPTPSPAPAPEPKATPAPEADAQQPGTAPTAAGDPKCARLIPTGEVKEVCGVDQPLIVAPSEALAVPGGSEGKPSGVQCARETSSDRVNKVAVAIIDYRSEATARAVAGNPAPGESAIEVKERRSGAVNTAASMVKGGLVLSARTRTVGDEAPLCTEDQLRALVKRVHGRLP